jgi:hypothetical protein
MADTSPSSILFEKSNPTNSIKSTVHIKLRTSSDEVHSRTLQDRVAIKIGRQVKANMDKNQSNQINKDAMLSSNELIRQLDDAPKMNIAQEDTAVAVNPPKLDTEPLWFKSKVVSRSHAEIWLKDGQVNNLSRL